MRNLNAARLRMHITMQPYEGYHDDHELPFEKGQIVTIPQGTKIHNVHKGHYVAGRNYKVKIHHFGCGQSKVLYMLDSRERTEYGIDRQNFSGEEWHNLFYPTQNPQIIWPGVHGYWSRCDINDILEANRHLILKTEQPASTDLACLS